MSLTTLPVELVNLICHYLADRNDLINLSLASSRLNHVAERLLFQEIHIKSITQAYRFLEIVSSKNRIDLVRSFKLDILASMSKTPDADGCTGFATGRCDMEYLTLFPGLEKLMILAPPFDASLIEEEMAATAARSALQNLKSCTIGFRSVSDTKIRARDRAKWDVRFFEPLVLHPGLDELELIDAQAVAEPSVAIPARLAVLQLWSCRLSHEWLHPILLGSDTLVELALVGTEHVDHATYVWDADCNCGRAMRSRIEVLTHLKRRPDHYISSAHNQELYHGYADFARLRDLTVAARELCGRLYKERIDYIVSDPTRVFPRTLETLVLYTRSNDFLSDYKGRERGLFRLLFAMFEQFPKHQLPRLHSVQLRIDAQNPSFPPGLVNSACKAGVELSMSIVADPIPWNSRTLSYGHLESAW